MDLQKQPQVVQMKPLLDSLKNAGMEKEWSKALEKAQRFTSLAFFFAMMTGSAFYDHRFINECLYYFGSDLTVNCRAGHKSSHFSNSSFFPCCIIRISGNERSVCSRKNWCLKDYAEILSKNSTSGKLSLEKPLPFDI